MQVLPKNFFAENPLIKRSAAAIVYFRIQSDADAKIEANLDQFTRDPEFAGRLDAIEKERKTIAALDAEGLANLLRKPFDPMNLRALSARANELGADAFRAIFRRYATSYQDSFVEAAAYLYAKADKCYTEDLLANYETIRNPYSRSLAGMLFGIHHLEQSQDLLLQEYRRLLNDPREPALAQGPLLGIYILHDKT